MPHGNRLLKMSVFVKTAELGSFAAAASALEMSAQIVGRHIGELEKQLGVQLLTRTTRRQSLTDAGRVYLAGCKRALEAVEDADAAVAEARQVPTGVLRVTAPVEVGAAVLAPRLPEFLARHPRLMIELMLLDRRVDLIEENFDVALRIGQLTDSGLHARALVPFRLVTCAAPEYLRRRGVPQTPEDLAHHECLDYAFHNYPAPSNWTFRRLDGEVTVQPAMRMVINDGHALVSTALSGAGIIRASALAVAPLLATGQLVTLLAEFESDARPMNLVYPAQRFRLPRLRAFVEWLADILCA